MDIENEFIKLLEPLDIFDLTDENSIIKKEITVISKQLQNMANIIQRLDKSCFFDTMNTEELKQYRLFYNITDTASDEAVKKALKERLGKNIQTATKAGVKKLIAGGGLQADIKENPGTKNVTVTITKDDGLFVSREEAEIYIRNCMPFYINFICEWKII